MPNDLVQAATAARLHAVATYSGFKIGAAIETAAGRVFTGCNIENASLGLTVCAERVALFKALTDGEREFTAIAVVARASNGAMPCGACRQLLAEYAPAATVFTADSARPERVRTFKVTTLIPGAFLHVPARKTRKRARGK